VKDPEPMETMQQALERLSAAGYRQSLQATPAGFVALGSGEVHRPEDLVVEEIVRFEGASDPEDEAVLLALRGSDDGLRATFVSSFGVNADPVAGDLVRRLEDGRSKNP